MIGMSLNFVHRHVCEKRPTKNITKRSDRLYNHFSLLGFLLLPGERTLVAAGHVTSCDNGILIKSQLTFSFFAAFSHLGGPLRKQKFTLTGSKGHDLWSVIGGFRSVFWVSLFQGSLLVIVIIIDGSDKRNWEGGVWTLEFACFWRAQ